ncbi:MAG: hypothetical protein IMZ53_01440 [Thermoplasmata archaeon]|nr:hypothetical protein [Thermoplasmata archaeon]MBE3139226.1 hypothetical protein [Thermoplasmata archaeon]
MSDGSGVDFGVPRSKPYVGDFVRSEYDRIFWKKETVGEKMKRQQISESDYEKMLGFLPQDHEQMK